VVEARPNDLPEGGVEIMDSDTGVGVDPNFRELIFTKFYQSGDLTKHSTSKSRFKGGGSGLGLAKSEFQKRAQLYCKWYHLIVRNHHPG